MGLTARGTETSVGFVTETYSADPQVVAEAVYDWLQIQYKESALAAIEGFAAEMNNSYRLAGTIGENVMRFVLQYDAESRKAPSFERGFVHFLQRNCHLHVPEAQAADCLEALGRHILAQLSVYRVLPKQYFYR